MRHRNDPRSILILGLLLLAGPAAGASENIAVRLVSEEASLQPGRPLHVGLHMKMRGAWHTYWKNPGDSGMPLRITWKLPPGFSAGPIEWPAPERIPTETLMSYGYGKEVLLPVRIKTPEHFTGDSVTLSGTFDWLECEEICVPGSAVLSLSLPVRREPPAPGPDAPLFAEARSRMPEKSAGWSFAAEAGPRAISLVVRSPRNAVPRNPYFFIDQPLVAEYGAAQGFERLGEGYRITLTPSENATGTPERLTGVLVLEERGGGRSRSAVQVDAPVSRGDPAPAPVPSGATSPAARYAALIALVGLGSVLFWRAFHGRRRNGEPERG